MDKNVKLLVESLFDDFDDIYDDDTDVEEVSSKIQKLNKISSLAECTSVDEINMYLYEKMLDTKEKEGEPLNTWLNSVGTYSFNKGYYKFSNKIFLSNTVADSPELMYRGKMTKFPNAVYINVLFHMSVKDSVIWEISTRNVSQQAAKIITQFNKKNSEERDSNITNAILSTIQFAYKTDRLYEELTCTGKVYKVVDKDIQRMSKCLLTGNYTGFDAITKPEKMVARLAALFICAKKQGYSKMTLGFNDDILLRVITDYAPYKTSNNRRGDYIGVLRRLQKFPTLHLKDVIATYNEYINKF